MIDPALTPTRLVRPEERGQPPIRPVEALPRFHTVRLLWLFASWAAVVAAGRLTGRLTPEQNARHLVQLLERLGGLWNMAGQLMSVRVDLFSATLCRQLSSLQTHGTGFPFEDARRVIEQELGRPLEEIFDEFAPEPFAATWVSQIHRARLRREQVWTAVKVQRPDVRERFACDLTIIERLATWLERLRVGSTIRWRIGVWELRQIAEHET